MNVEYIDHMGDDKRVVNVARVSFDKWDNSNELTERDIKLIHYLATHGHWSPFAHPQLSLRVSAPIVVARQLFKHQVGLIVNEVSRRYVDTPPLFYMPDTWRGAPENKKQGSSDLIIKELDITYHDAKGESVEHRNIEDEVGSVYTWMADLYELMIKNGVCPEQARLILPQAMYTTWIWTGSLAAFMRICNLRLMPDVQKETRELVSMISEIVQNRWPVSYQALINKEIPNE